MNPGPHDLPAKPTFIGKPFFSAKLVNEHLRAKLPGGQKPEPLKRELS